jgi:hypothetical protein
MIVLGGIVAVFVAIGGWVGWHIGTRGLYRRSFDALDAPLASNPKLIQRRLWYRLLLTVLFGAGGAVVCFIFLFALNR